MRFPSIFQENSRLSAQCSAQESVIEGLREERKLWGKELAHQGAALAQDRGRMEAQLDTLTKECRALQVHDMYIHMQEFLTHAIGHADMYDLHHRDLFKILFLVPPRIELVLVVVGGVDSSKLRKGEGTLKFLCA